MPARLAPLVDLVRARGGWIVSTHFTLVPAKGGEPMISPHLKALRPFLAKGDFLPGAWGHALVDELAPADLTVEKIAYSAFYMTRLEWVLRKAGIEKLYVAGIVTNGGVASTVARRACARSRDGLALRRLRGLFAECARDRGRGACGPSRRNDGRRGDRGLERGMSGVLEARGVVFEAEASVLIVGAGAAGLCAALTAHEAGADVVVIERDKTPRGSTSLSAGLIPAAGTRFQLERGIADDHRTFAADIQRKAGGGADPAIVEAVTRNAGPTSNGSRTATACLLGRA